MATSGSHVDDIWKSMGRHLGAHRRHLGTILVTIFASCGRHIVISWATLEMIWTTSGSHMEDIWASFGPHLDDIGMSCGRHLGVIWATFGIHLGDIPRISWRTSGDQLDDILVSCGGHLWAIWTTYGGLSEDRTGKPTTCHAMELGTPQRLTIAPNGCFVCYFVCVFMFSL